MQLLEDMFRMQSQQPQGTFPPAYIAPAQRQSDDESDSEEDEEERKKGEEPKKRGRKPNKH